MYSVEILGFRFSLGTAADAVAVEQPPMDSYNNQSILATLGRPQVAFSLACLSITILAFASVWNNQKTSTARVDHDKTEGAVSSKNRAGTSSSENTPTVVAKDLSSIEKISALTTACAELSRLLHGTSDCDESLRQPVTKTVDESSKIIGLLCQIQTALIADPTCFFDKTGLAAVFETTFNSILTACADAKTRCGRDITAEDLDTLRAQLRNGRSTLEFLKINLEPQGSAAARPTVRFERSDSTNMPGHKRSLTVPIPQPSADLITPGADVKKWLEEPPEPGTTLESEPLPEYTVLPPVPASPSKSNTAAKRNVTSMADIHAILASNTAEESLQKLLSTGVDPNDTYGRLTRTALHEAARLNKPDCIDVLVKTGALIDAEDGKGDTALHLAAWEGHVEACASLLDAGAEIDRLSGRDGCSPLFCAVGAKHIDLVRLLLREGARVSLKSPSEMYPLHQAAVTAQAAACEALLEAGAHVDVQDKDGNAPLHNAAAIGSVGSIKVLLGHGAQVDAKSRRSMTALHWASHKGHDAVVKTLLDAGADEDEREQGGATPLCCAASRGHVGCVKALLKSGANRKLSCESWDGGSGTAAQLAKRNGHKDVVALLKTYGL